MEEFLVVCAYLFITRRHTDTENALWMLIKFTIDDTCDCVFHQCLAEIEQIPEFEARQSQMGEYLFLVRFGDGTTDHMDSGLMVGHGRSCAWCSLWLRVRSSYMT